ncbi:LacI family DNA-binding transcriptional regulator [Streptomyces sp. NBC_00059]|uniref:LacI family DNA-binding transcriptional regulator n=1 Tax=Streptomyces sp. NBC_00059 TaxID=2975635 RepID=UPI002257AB5C|nr:LacI family DNA-binding transcriptional regulator [Streptomyces sp. NBC_00059]MCX5413969.1 LacI family transcriptional regulator [Streptomyces sp. NBC_00059]
MERRVGIKDVAREAGVSLGTVSNVLNRPEIVAESTRRRVLDVIGAIGFVRTEGARQLHGLASRVVAVLGHGPADPFLTALGTGVEQAAREADLGVMVCTGARDPAEEARHLSLITSHRVRGAVLASAEGVGRTVAAFRRSAVPFVVADQPAAEPAACSVGIDDAAGGRAAVRHLLERGHRSLAYVAGPGHLRRMRDHRTGAREAARAAGLPSAALRELSCTALTVEAGREAGRRVLGLPGRPAAVLCADDLLALGVLQALYEAGLRVPDDIAVVGYGDNGLAASAVVPLTSVRRPAVAMGRQAGRLLVEDTAGEGGHEHCHVVLRPELVVRRSTQAKPAR